MVEDGAEPRVRIPRCTQCSAFLCPPEKLAHGIMVLEHGNDCPQKLTDREFIEKTRDIRSQWPEMTDDQWLHLAGRATGKHRPSWKPPPSQSTPPQQSDR